MTAPDEWTDAHTDAHTEAYDDWRDAQNDAADAASEAPWEITDDAGANWALRKIARGEAEIARVTEIANEEITRIQQWRNDALRTLVDDISFFKAALIHYRRTLEANDPSLPKTYKLPAGDLTRRKGATRIEVTDEAAFLAWADANDPGLYARKPLVSRIKDQKDRYQVGIPDGDEGVERTVPIISDEGEVVPGVQAVFACESYGVRAR